MKMPEHERGTENLSDWKGLSVSFALSSWDTDDDEDDDDDDDDTCVSSFELNNITPTEMSARIQTLLIDTGSQILDLNKKSF